MSNDAAARIMSRSSLRRVLDRTRMKQGSVNVWKIAEKKSCRGVEGVGILFPWTLVATPAAVLLFVRLPWNLALGLLD
jgi:hypothetical protein